MPRHPALVAIRIEVVFVDRFAFFVDLSGIRTSDPTAPYREPFDCNVHLFSSVRAKSHMARTSLDDITPPK